ncbi:hypothetical protein Tco_0195603 [Tanacetum coccineum]
MMMENKCCGELMIENHWMDKLLKEVLMIDELSIVETDKVNHYKLEMDMFKLVVKLSVLDELLIFSQRSLATRSTVIDGQASGPFSTEARIILP